MHKGLERLLRLRNSAHGLRRSMSLLNCIAVDAAHHVTECECAHSSWKRSLPLCKHHMQGEHCITTKALPYMHCDIVSMARPGQTIRDHPCGSAAEQRALSRWHSMLVTMCCAQQLNDVANTLQLRQQISLHAQYTQRNVHALAAKLQRVPV